MAQGKNKQVSKKGKVVKKGDRHPFTKKEWFQVMAPPALKDAKQVGWTCCKKPTGTQIVSDFLKYRVAEISLADITNSGKDVTKKIKIQFDDISGNSCFTSFYEYELAREKVAAMLKKRQSLIEVISEVKTKEGVIFRVFIIAVTSRRPGQQKLNSYAQTSKIRLFRKKVNAELIKLASERLANDFAHEVIQEVINPKLEAIGAKVIPGIKMIVHKLKISKKNATEIRSDATAAPAPISGDKKIDEHDKAKTAL
jgi:small subunit ribosomal protein S3Ae